jgi:hypothetical protein
MGPILVSKNGNYILAENNLYSFIEDETYSLNEMSFERMVGFFKENSTYLYKNKLKESVEIISMHRKLVYQICEHFKPTDRTSLMMEFEAKFGNLITENTLLFESWLSTAYDWTIGALINRVKSYGPGFIKLAKDLFSGNIKEFMEDIRAILFSPEGMAIEAGLAATGIGGIGPAVAWGVMLAYDIYLKATGDPNSNWFNIIIDAVGCGGLAYIGKAFRGTLQATGLFQRAAGKGISEVVEAAAKNPKTGGLIKSIGEKISQKLPGITSTLKSAAEWATKKLKINWFTKVVDSFSEMMAKFLDSLGVSASKKVQGKFAQGVGGKFQAKQLRNVAALKSGFKSGLKNGTLAYGIGKGAETETGQKFINKGLSAIGQNPYDDILKAGKTTGLDFGPVVP